MNEEKMIRLLDEMNVLCRDDGHKFTIELRLDVIKKNLENSQYILTKGKLCHIYSKKPLNQIKKAVVVSSHVDCEEQIHNCFSEQIDFNLLKLNCP